MLPSLVVTVGLLMQAVGNPQPVAASRAPRPEPVRVWRTDSVAYVQLVQQERGAWGSVPLLAYIADQPLGSPRWPNGNSEAGNRRYVSACSLPSLHHDE